ncbi:MAG: DsrE family protein [Candidatus Bathyarchaeota archaeon]|jgi:uncharacterized protein involved in oxidation of intracellular sulfur|nr:DsrE family protein [Candidatus Bathyarchaeota archaeon]|tara:strand:+ start:88 stop:327 length:240 start_codon:yes stop_codon:yes gene_type:complete
MVWTLIVNNAPYNSENPSNALRLVFKATSQGIERCLFFMGDSLTSAKTKQRTPNGFYNIEKMLVAMINTVWRTRRVVPT